MAGVGARRKLGPHRHHSRRLGQSKTSPNSVLRACSAPVPCRLPQLSGDPSLLNNVRLSVCVCLSRVCLYLSVRLSICVCLSSFRQPFSCSRSQVGADSFFLEASSNKMIYWLTAVNEFAMDSPIQVNNLNSSAHYSLIGLRRPGPDP